MIDEYVRKTYRNGDAVLKENAACDSCTPQPENVKHRTVFHDASCPEAWRDQAVRCESCGMKFYPARQGQTTCGRFGCAGK